MIISWHRVQYTLSTASTQDYLCPHRSHVHELTPYYSLSFRGTSQKNQPPSSSSPWELYGKVTLTHPHSCELTKWSKESQHSGHHPSTASKYLSKLTQLWPPKLHDHGFQACLQTRTIMASMCISNLTWLWPQNLHINGLQVYLYTRSIPASKSR